MSKSYDEDVPSGSVENSLLEREENDDVGDNEYDSVRLVNGLDVADRNAVFVEEGEEGVVPAIGTPKMLR